MIRSRRLSGNPPSDDRRQSKIGMRGMKRRRIRLFGMNFPPEPTGIAPYAGALALGMSAAGFEVEVHVPHPHYPEWRCYEGYGGWQRAEWFHNVRVWRTRHYLPSPPRGFKRLVSEITLGFRFCIARWKSPDVVIAISPPLFANAFTAVRARLNPRRPRLILWVQDIYSLGMAETGEGNAFVQLVTRWIEGRVSRAADALVVIHPRFRDFVVEEFGVVASRVTVLPNWAHLPESQTPDKTAARESLGFPTDRSIAIHTGNMGVKQGLENIIDAARTADANAAPVHFVLVGDGGERKKLESYAKGVERITFVDPLEHESYRQALAAADVFLVNEKPGVSAMAMPSKLTTYFGAGRPVVAATDALGITASEISAAGAGVVVPAGDPVALLEAVIAVLKDPQMAERYAENGRRYRNAVLGENVAMVKWRAVIDAVTRS